MYALTKEEIIVARRQEGEGDNLDNAIHKLPKISYQKIVNILKNPKICPH